MESLSKIIEKMGKIKNVEAIYLFGSHATGMDYEKSDIDLCVITKSLDNKTEDKVMSFYSE